VGSTRSGQSCAERREADDAPAVEREGRCSGESYDSDSQSIRSGCAAEEILHHLSIAAPGRQSLSVSENEHLITLVERLGGADVGGVDDHRAMNPEE
jgi:hypothetical protein